MSPRCKKPRKCECPFRGKGACVFKPSGTPLSQLKKVTLFQDELETLRLCDMEGLTQEAAGEKMGVSRGTVQRLLASAREKVSTALIERSALTFSE